MSSLRITGLVAAPYTPMLAAGASGCASVDLASVPAHAAALAAQGVRWAFVCGSTGEGPTLSVSERSAVVEAWVAAALAEPAADRLRVIVHCGAESLADTLALAAHASALAARTGGAASPLVALGVVAPTYNKPAGVAAVVDLLAAIAAAAPALALYYYHIPIKTGVHLRCDALLAAVHAVRAARVPTFAGIKYTDFDLHMFANCVAFEGGAYDILSGRDEALLGFLAMGGKGAVGSTYKCVRARARARARVRAAQARAAHPPARPPPPRSYQGREYNALLAAHARGDAAEALRLQRLTQASVDLLLTPDAYGGPRVNIGKALMEMRLGGHTGPPRYPALPMPDDAKARLRADATAAGFFAGLQA